VSPHKFHYRGIARLKIPPWRLLPMLKLLTNFDRFPERWRSSSGVEGTARKVTSVVEILRYSRAADFIIINCEADLTLQLAAAYLFMPFLRRPVLCHDLALRRPTRLRARLLTPVKRFLLRRIDHFTLHFRILDGYQQYFGIGPERASYLPSKPNIRYRYQYNVGPDGDYVLCFGRSERDYDSFFAAMATLGYPAAIPPPNFEALRKHGSRFTWRMDALPPNVRILADEGGNEGLIRMMEKARLIVLPIMGSRIAPSGIGSYLNAMLLGKCVILTEGPAASDIFTDEVILVPPEDPKALAEAIRRAWEDDELRLRTALAGQRYSESCGGEPELRQRVLDRALEKLALRQNGSTL
jgi:glycosyltransferase involved in cell wall biosynthesis